MNASLTQLSFVSDEGFFDRKALKLKQIVTYIRNQALTKCACQQSR